MERKAIAKPGVKTALNAKRGFDVLGATKEEGLQTALAIKLGYEKHEPIVLPDDNTRMITPENMLNRDLDLRGIDAPLPLAMVATKDPESPMALAALTRLSPYGKESVLAKGICQVVGETSKHPLVRRCVELVTDSGFSPNSIAIIQRQTARFIVQTRRQYSVALKENLRLLLDGSIAPRAFIREFFELTEAGNLRSDIRGKLVISLLLSPTVRPSVKFVLLENFERLSKPVRLSIIRAVLKAPPSRHLEIIKEELRWIVTQEKANYDAPYEGRGKSA